jgi:hypothetical protein
VYEDTAYKRFQRYDRLAKDPEQLKLVLQGKKYKDAIRDMTHPSVERARQEAAERKQNPPKNKYPKYRGEVTETIIRKKLLEFMDGTFPQSGYEVGIYSIDSTTQEGETPP